MTKQADTRFRICNVSFLNSAPYRSLRELEWAAYDECSPAECARRLAEDECDLGLVPIVDTVINGSYEILPFCLGASGAVQSVTLLSDSPIESVQYIYASAHSNTSVILLKVLLAAIVGTSKEIKIFKVNPSELAVHAAEARSASLVIGDQVFALKNTVAYRYDLGAMWREHTGLPFVFAAWAGRLNKLSTAQREELIGALSYGIKNRAAYARDFATEHGIDKDFAETYVSQTIAYELDDAHEKGRDEFIRRANDLGLLPKFTRRGQRSIDAILSDAAEGKRISIAEGLSIAAQASLADLSLAATHRRQALHEGTRVSYIVDRNVNYTNVCNVYCRFCAFYSAPGKEGGYLLTKEQIGKKIEETVAAGGIQILLQGGLNPELGIEYYEDLFHWIKANYPINLHALSADEILHIAKVSQLSVHETISRLIAAGLGSLPGAGAEILVDRVRRRIARLKTCAADWLNVHRVAHELGLISTCTMLFGVQETWEDRLLHMQKLRELQDQTHGFTAFITWPFQDENTKLKPGNTSSPEYLRVQAVARLFLDNISHIQSSWVTQGPAVGQVALHFGADDFGSVMFEENVVSAAGTTFCMNSDTIERHILEAGFLPWQRDVWYQEAISHG